MFDIEILGYNFYREHDKNKYPVVKIEAKYEDDFLCMPIKIERYYDAYDWICNWIDHMNDKALDDMIENFVDELWKEFHKGLPKVYEIRLYITLPIIPTTWIRQHIDNEFKRRLAMKRKDYECYKRICNIKFGIISHDIYAQYDINKVARAKEKIKEYEKMKIENVIFNDPATIVFWRDGSKTAVKAIDEPYDPEKGLAMAIAKKAYGNEANYYNEFKKFIKDVKEDDKNE